MEDTTINAVIAAASADHRTQLSEIESKRIVAALGVPVSMPRPAASADEAVKLARAMGFPVVLKVLAENVSHKSEVGGVALNLDSEGRVREAFASIRDALKDRMPQARFDGVSVQAMAPRGVELLAGITRDAAFGPMVLAGIGGVLVEVLADTVLRLAPVGPREAREMLLELRGAALLRGVRGGAAVDLDAMADLIVKLSRLALAHPEIAEMDLNPVAAYPDGVRVLDARVLIGKARPEDAPDAHHAQRMENLKRAFAARTVAVIGDKKMGGYMWLRAMAKFKGKLYSIQIDPKEIPGIEAMGVKNLAGLGDIPEPIDYAVSAVPRQVAPRILQDCIANRVGAIGFFTSGFSETAEELGVRLEAQLKSAASASEIALVGPNCMGLYSPAIGMCNFPDQHVGEAGDVCFISQSGTHTINFCLQAPVHGIRVNKAASIGNAIVLGAADYLDLMTDDPGTRMIGMYLEGTAQGRRFFESLRRAAARHPVAIWKGGVTAEGARATFSHTASLATPDALWSAIVRQSGAVEVDSLDGMLDAAALFVRARPVTGRRMGLVAMTGGQSVVITDTFARAGLKIPALSPGSYEELKGFFNTIGGSYRNPLDAGGTIGSGINQDSLDRILSILERDSAIDAVVLEIGTGLRAARWAAHEDEIVALLDKLAAHARSSSKAFAVVLHAAHVEAIVARARELARARGLVAFDSFASAARAFAVAATYHERRAALGASS